MNEAYDYARPSAFIRGMEIAVPAGSRLVFVSGTASVGPKGETLHRGDFRAQARRAFENAGRVLAAAGAGWKDVVKTTVFLKDIRRHYRAFNEERLAFFQREGIQPYPASTCIEARLCREDLLVEMEAIAIAGPASTLSVRRDRGTRKPRRR